MESTPLKGHSARRQHWDRYFSHYKWKHFTNREQILVINACQRDDSQIPRSWPGAFVDIHQTSAT